MKPFLLVLALLLAAPARAQEGEEVERLELRVVSAAAGVVVVDRGRSDGVAEGDAVTLRPRDGGAYEGAVVRVKERSADVELQDRTFVPAPGTRGEVAVPRARRAAPPPDAGTTPEAPAPPEHVPWENEDKGYGPGQPLLADVRPVRPEERRRRVTGRAYLIGELARDSDDDWENSFLRVGAEIDFENPFLKGDGIHFQAELDYLTEHDDGEGLDLLVQGLSYRRGGTRFDASRWEAGRFAQLGMPEFGVLDGFEWGRRRGNGHRYGASIGFLPEPDDDFESLSDLQVAGYYEWVSGDREQLAFGGGFQKTWHDGEPDRDLLVAKLRYLPLHGWDVHGIAWVDFYTGSDDIKGQGVEVTQAIAGIGREWAKGGVDLSYRRLRFPELLRQGEFLPPPANEIANDRYDRVALDFWKSVGGESRAHGYAAGWDDEDGSGGAGELGLELRDFLLRRSRADLTVFVSFADHEDVAGARASIGQVSGSTRWDLFYEVSEHHIDGFPSDINDLIQHRIRASLGAHRATWDATLYGEATLYDTEFAWTFGLFFQRRF
jgi:hypothetical protein